MYSLRFLFFSLPLYFSHVFSPLGVTIGETYAFERYKVYLFLMLIAAAYIEMLIRYPDRILYIFHKYFLHIIILLILPIVSALYFSIPLDIDWLMGSHEKHHGYLFYVGVLLLANLLYMSNREQLRSYIKGSIYAAIVVALIAIGEYMGGVYDIYGRSEMLSAYPGRSVSTLGNPNYVAGYLLIFLPLFVYIRTPERWVILGLLSIAILTTGSYIAMGLMGLYCLYRGLRYLQLGVWFAFLLVLSAAILGGYIASRYLDPDKLLSLTSRFVLMRESLTLMIRDPLSWCIGFGPDSILTHFAQSRSLLVNSYFPANMSIDSSHNILIDILFQYGVVPLMLIGGSIIANWKNQKEELQMAILLGGAFLVLNVYVVVHVVTLMLLFAMGRSRD